MLKKSINQLFPFRNISPLICFSNIFIFSQGESANKKFTSTFKIRSKLSQFFKHIHPDQMNQAPTKIKQENMRSLKNFNQYIDAINQQKSIEGKLLKFYVAEKMNHKSKKFFSFNLQLPDIQSHKINQEKAQKLLQNIVNALNSKFKQSQEGGNLKNNKKQNKKTNNFGQLDTKQTQVKFQTDQQRIQREQSTVKPFHLQKSYKNKLLQQRLKNQINSKFIKSQKQNLQMKLRKNVSFADTASSKPMMWARLANDQSGLYKDYQNILNSLIDPKLIYFDQKLTEAQIQEFKKKLLPGGLDPLTLRNNDYINDVCQQMQSFQPPICFYVSNRYSGTDIPGFFTVPYNFKPKQLKMKFDQFKDKIQEEQLTFIQYYDYYKQLQKQLIQENFIKVNLKQFKGNDDIRQKILMMKRLSRYSLKNQQNNDNKQKITSKITFYPMNEQEYQLTLNHYFLNKVNNQKQQEVNIFSKQSLKPKTGMKIQLNNKLKVFHLINFKDIQMEQLIDEIKKYTKDQQTKLENS